MSLRKLYYSLSPNMRFLARKLYYLPIDTFESITGKREKYQPPRGEIYTGSGDFVEQGKLQFSHLEKHTKISPSDAVLDIGSGIGRTANRLTKFLNDQARYEGFDVVEKGVNWCNKTIKRDFPNFNFVYVPLNNDLYNETNDQAVDFTFPYEDNSFDIVFLFSVFTHMGIDEIAHYFKEINRVLKPGGQCLGTYFIYDKQLEAKISNRASFNFPVKKEGHRLMDEKVTAANIAISEDRIEKMISNAQLKKVCLIEGHWRDPKKKSDIPEFQDILVLEKTKD